MPNPTATRWTVTSVVGVDVHDAVAVAADSAHGLDGLTAAGSHSTVADVTVPVTYDLEIVPADGEDLTDLQQRIADHLSVPVSAVAHVG